MLNSQKLIDSSDNVWSIVIPKVNSFDLDLKECYIGNYKDSLIKSYFENNSNWDYLIAEIKIIGTDSSAFSLVSDSKSMKIPKKSNIDVEFRFKPIKAGLNEANLMAISKYDTINQKIVGFGIEKKIKILTENIDFGEVEIGNDSIIKDIPIIQNIGSEIIESINFKISGPDFEQFEILHPNVDFDLNPDEIKKFDLKFKPKYLGRTSSQIQFNYANSINPLFSSLFGKANGAMIYVENDSAFVGETREIKLKTANIKPGGFLNIADNFKAKIRFQKTVLSVKDASNWQILNDSIIISLSANLDNSDILAKVNLTAGLGNFEQTSIDIIQFDLFDINNNKINDFDFETKSGIFKVLGICDEGGKRLINPENVSNLKIEKDEKNTFVNLKINLIEKGSSKIRIINSNGKLMEQFDFNDTYENLLLNINISDYPSGVFFVLLDTPTLNISQQFLIIK